MCPLLASCLILLLVDLGFLVVVFVVVLGVFVVVAYIVVVFFLFLAFHELATEPNGNQSEVLTTIGTFMKCLLAEFPYWAEKQSVN